MFLAILGIFVVVFTAVLAKSNPKFEGISHIGRYVAITLVVLGISTSCFVQIEPGEVGVQTLFGKVQSGILTEGLNFINPLVQVVRFDGKTQNYTMSGIHDEGDKMGDDAIRVLSADGLEVEIDLTVLYRVESAKAPEILRTIGTDYREKIVRPTARTEIRNNAVFYDAVALYSTQREAFQQKVYAAIEKEFGKRGLMLEQIGIRNINLPASVKQAIEEKINAEQASQKMKFVLDKERQEADRKRVEAQGIADYQRIITSSLTDKLLQYESIKAQKELAGSNNAKIVVLGKNAPILLNQ
jgi:regulator of protease activity HflC (stomatin/prohibitin superfamily)